MTTEARVDRLGRELGDLLEEHGSGLGPGARECAKFRDDPVGFDQWGGRAPVEYQCNIMRSVVTNRYTTVRSGHGCGKDWLLGSLAVWAAYARRMLVLVISATERQVIGQSMLEVFDCWRAHQRAGHKLCGQAFRQTLRIDNRDRIVAITGGASVDALVGWHDEAGVLVLVSESQSEALERSVYNAFDAVTTNAGSRVAVLGNPIRAHGPFRDIHQRKSWQRFAVSVFDTPNVRAGRIVHPAFPAPEWPRNMAREHGEDSPWYVARVLGEFPVEAENSLIRVAALDAASDPARAVEVEAEVRDRETEAVMGVDLARQGADQSAIVVRRGPLLWALYRYREPDGVENVRRIVTLVRGLIAQRVGVRTVVVDEAALGGTIFDLLRRELQTVQYWQPVYRHHWGDWDSRKTHPQAVGFMSGRRAKQADRFVDLRAQSYMHLRDQVEGGRLLFRRGLDAALVSDLREELLAHEYQHEGDDRIRVGSKDNIRARLARSPDLSDACMMTYLTELHGAARRVQWA